jgi:hypothetical protein
MALKKVDEGTRTVSIDKVIGKTKNGIEVNGVAYWYSKKSGQSVVFDAGDVVQLTYTHLIDSETKDNVYMIQELDNTTEDKEKMIDKAAGQFVENFDAKPASIPTFSNTKQELSKDEIITNMNILNRAVDWCIAFAREDDEAVLERCRRFKKMLSEF